jgi:biofilm PGA synthesis N-glycosyltransferase PgaC
VKLLFWLSLSLIFFAYAGYPICAYIRARYWPQPIRRASIFPRVTIILAVHNEEKNLSRKLDNLAALDYPSDRLEVIAISDGSTDKTNEILGAWQNSSRRAVILSEHRGKAHALNCGLASAQGEIICFNDARQTIARDGLKNLVANFADPSVGCVSGDIALGDPTTSTETNGLGIYWWLETHIRRWEGAIGCLIGAAGCFYAVRKLLIVPFRSGMILDDVFLPLYVARQGKKVVFEPMARGWDSPQTDQRREFRRKVRTLTGNYQLLQREPWLLSSANPLRFQFVCHKVLRLIAPFAFAGLFVSSFVQRGLVYRGAFLVQVVCYALALVSLLRIKLGIVSRMADASSAFLMLNAAAIVALFYFVIRKKQLWAG